jgi:hypothetical protein
VTISSPSDTSGVRAAPSHYRPSDAILRIYGLENTPRREVFCYSCARRNTGHGYFLFMQIGHLGFYRGSKGRFPNDPARYGKAAGKPRGDWVITTGIFCDHGHYTGIAPDHKIVHCQTLDELEKAFSALHAPAGSESIANQIAALYTQLVERWGPARARAVLEEHGVFLLK